MKRKLKKMENLWDIFREIQQKHIDSCKLNNSKVLAFALANIEWEGYAKALLEFGVIDQEAFDNVMSWVVK